MPRYDIYNHVIQFKPNLTNCPEQGWGDIWRSTDFFILITGLVANTALLWLFLKERKSLSASKVLGVNLAVMDLIYLSIMPVSIIYDVTKQVNKNNSDRSATDLQSPNTAHSVQQAREIFSIFNLIGCPLLLTCMCIECYMAVIRPVLYRRMGKWEYRMAVSAVVWVVTLFFCLATGLVGSSIHMVLPVSIIISCLFLLMLTCLGGVLWSLLQQSPAHTTFGNQARSESPLKRRAVKNVLFVVVPAVMSYLPVLMMVPLVFYIKYCNVMIDRVLCEIFELSLLFPNLGVFIGPLFYLSKARQMCCLRGTGKTSNA